MFVRCVVYPTNYVNDTTNCLFWLIALKLLWANYNKSRPRKGTSVQTRRARAPACSLQDSACSTGTLMFLYSVFVCDKHWAVDSLTDMSSTDSSSYISRAAPSPEDKRSCACYVMLYCDVVHSVAYKGDNYFEADTIRFYVVAIQ